MRKLLCSTAAVVAVLGVWSAPTFANSCSSTACVEYITPPPLGIPTINDDPTLPLDGTANFMNAATVGNTHITPDTFEFTLSAATTFDVNANDQAKAGTKFASMTLRFLNSGGSPIAGDSVSGTNVKALDLDGVSLAAGTYFVEVLYTGGSGLSYHGTIDASAIGGSPTPIPAALPLFAGGVGLLGFGLRKRRKASQNV